jgi:DNA-binding NarL/FixJ family response regulator
MAEPAGGTLNGLAEFTRSLRFSPSRMQPEQPSMPARSRILVVEDHPLVREGVIHLLRQQPDLEPCGGVDTISGVSPAVRANHPDLMLLDMRLTDGDALPHIPAIHAEFPALRILVLSQFDEMLYAERVLQAGASGYIMKEQASQEVLKAIRTVLSGHIYVSRKLATRLGGRFAGIQPPSPLAGFEHLSDREQNVLKLLGVGMSTREIATELNLSIKTVETYRENLKTKLGINDSTELTRYAAELMDR